MGVGPAIAVAWALFPGPRTSWHLCAHSAGIGEGKRGQGDAQPPPQIFNACDACSFSTAPQTPTHRCNVDLLKLIQLGLTFTDADGNLPCIDGELCVWQFNFREFRVDADVHAADSIDLLRASGIDFARCESAGVDVAAFGELLMTSGVVLSDAVTWVTFHSGYDFGYLLKVLTCAPLPGTEAEFFELLAIYFPSVYDIKYLMKFCGNLHGGLNKLAETLAVERVGPQHQAGSDSLLTAATFVKLVRSYFSEREGALEEHRGVLYGLGSDGTGEPANHD